ncbi:hypothetical protein [Catellatospora chokoriensis]|uniref:Uncharacterized protein n=1 Tax=Catellatospora chokoriensis TaxID=310353 RepID=A0A8J3K0J6_9ACTN|nr:hypothetical protein [Catellatospora chokoriensis]GIF94457.1 hypothetical protein Cch02nite_79010 [Catellatospora chokoriensis]
MNTQQVMEIAGRHGVGVEILQGRGSTTTLARIIDAAIRATAGDGSYRPRAATLSCLGDRPQDCPDPCIGMACAGQQFGIVLTTVGDGPHERVTAAEAMRKIVDAITRSGLVVSVHAQAAEISAAQEHLRLVLGVSATPQLVIMVNRVADSAAHRWSAQPATYAGTATSSPQAAL